MTLNKSVSDHIENINEMQMAADKLFIYESKLAIQKYKEQNPQDKRSSEKILRDDYI